MREAVSSAAALCVAGLLCLPSAAQTVMESAFAGRCGGETSPLLPGLCRALPGTQSCEALEESVYASRRAMIRVLGELYLLSREDRHRRSAATWTACAAMARQLGCSPEFCRVLGDMARDDLSARERAGLRTELGLLSRRQAIDELALRQWVELLPLAPKRIRQAMDALPLGNLFWSAGEGVAPGKFPQAPVPGTSPLLDELLGVMDEQVATLSSIHDTTTADTAAKELLPMLLHLQAMRASMGRLGSTMANITATQEQQERFASLRQALAREWTRLREAGFYESADLMAVEGLVAVS